MSIGSCVSILLCASSSNSPLPHVPRGLHGRCLGTGPVSAWPGKSPAPCLASSDTDLLLLDLLSAQQLALLRGGFSKFLLLRHGPEQWRVPLWV